MAVCKLPQNTPLLTTSIYCFQIKPVIKQGLFGFPIGFKITPTVRISIFGKHEAETSDIGEFAHDFGVQDGIDEVKKEYDIGMYLNSIGSTERSGS